MKMYFHIFGSFYKKSESNNIAIAIRLMKNKVYV